MRSAFFVFLFAFVASALVWASACNSVTVVPIDDLEAARDAGNEAGDAGSEANASSNDAAPEAADANDDG